VALVVDPTQRLAAGERLRVHLPPEHCTVVAPERGGSLSPEESPAAPR
jgi:hypothetical protein